MIKFVKSITLIGVLSLTNFIYGTDQETANAIGHAISDISIALNSLDQSDYCLLQTTLDNSTLTDEQKSITLKADPEISRFLAVVETNVAIINNNNANEFILDPRKNDMVVDVVTADFDSRPDVGGCEAYRAGRRACNAKYISCSTVGYIGCLSAGPFYSICAAAVVVACTAEMVSCHDLNVAQYPDCGGDSNGVTQTWKPWLNSNDPSHKCN